jgi:hypothetical protein
MNGALVVADIAYSVGTPLSAPLITFIGISFGGPAKFLVRL